MSKLVLFCFPYAGGSGSIFNNWRNYLHHSIELQPIHYAGRGKRFQECCYQDMNEITNDIFENITGYINKSNYSFFGHSMGGLIAYELCKKMVSEGLHSPAHIFLSGIKPPNHVREKKVHNLPEKEFKEKIGKLNGTPKEILNNQELMDIYLPILRSDFKLIEEYEFSREGYKLNTSITAMYGKQDDITEEDMKKWTDFTSKDSQVRGYPGGHFFINENYIDIIDLINLTLVGRGGFYDQSYI
ncbi:thioesterase II family protein [Metabacillus hrfriensis]|uniref:Thioesterase domain-containing protein n=1 Tax=Metabacillus hrfriensis TaxID=3048891 RepID=A0ACD4R6B6_9BACI|nr:thioesterase domain-containing protein [Metabacillus sp. CT-WN-B3]WHZ55989.1 thioesterase domain-containing protein [Metabacillus sp. CT-WN-B3]